MPPPDASLRPARNRSVLRRAFSLVEVLVAAGVLTMLVGGLFAAMLQSRRLTEGSIFQNSANTIMQGYVEQIKNMEFADLPYLTKAGTISPGTVSGSPATLLTRSIVRVVNAADGSVENQSDPLVISSATTIPKPSTILDADTPADVVDNIKLFDINNTPDNPSDDLRLRVWIWINDISDDTRDATRVRGITIIYSWRVNGLKDTRSFVGTVRTIRSSVPTF